MTRKIQFGFWNYVESGVFGKEAVKDWKELRCTLPMSFTFDVKRHKKEDMLEILDTCEREGMKLIVCDSRTHFRTLQTCGEEAFVAGVKQAYQDFGTHPAIFGFFVGAEPRPDENTVYIRTVQLVMKYAPGLVPFANLVPYWGGGSDYDMLIGAAAEEHTRLVDDLLRETDIPLLGYDQYSQCLDEAHNQECGIISYFYVLDQYRELTKKHGIPFYVSLLACGHWCFREPTREDIRWQIYTALAHGARGIIWFHLYQYEAGESFTGMPLCGPERMRNPLFDTIKREQYIFDCYYREQFDKMEVTDVYHVGHIYDPTKRFCADEILMDINGKNSYPTILTYYKEYESGRRWMSIVNAHQRLANRITLKYQTGREEVFWLAPGEMKLLAIDPV